jgi:hypothetical protein
MNWIEILYPKPSFYISPVLGKFRHVHKLALSIAYYITQTLALLLLALIYWTLIVGTKIWMTRKSKDPLQRKYAPELKSYFQESKNVKSIKFQRMY